MEAGQGAPGHKRFEEMAVAHVLGGLSQTDGRIFRAHLLECGECRARVGELRAIAHELADVERDERRVRSARAIETKRRQADEDEQDPPQHPPPGRLRGRVLPVVALVVVAALAAWGYTLRQNMASLQTELSDRLDASTVLELGDDWELVSAGEGVEGTVKIREGQLVLLADGLDEDEVFGFYVLGSDDVLYRAPVQAPGGRLLTVPVDVPASADRALLTQPNGQPGREPEGATLLEARRPD